MDFKLTLVNAASLPDPITPTDEKAGQGSIGFYTRSRTVRIAAGDGVGNE